jgi:DNA polymerase-3 subunit epsilon
VAFDYNVIKSEFKRIGIDWEAERLCTVKASRRIFPEKKSYALGNLTGELNITIENRHRAASIFYVAVDIAHFRAQKLVCLGADLVRRSIVHVKRA